MATDSGIPAGGEPVSEERLPEAVVEEIRSDDRRRALLDVLAERDGEMPLLDLARAVVARERDVDPAAISADDVNDARNDIYERHLPKLTATDVVRFDSLVSTVELAADDGRLYGT